MAPGGTKGAGSKAATKAASGIFAKHAGELFRVGKGKKVIGLDPAKISREKRREWAKKRPSKTPPAGDQVKSTKIDPYDTKKLSPGDREMVEAIKEARKQNNHDKGDNNYAALRFIDSDGRERVLVTHSDGVHSERMGANYLLENGIPPENIRDVITERSPCDKRSAYCDQWMKAHIPESNSKHFVDYDINGTSRDQANKWVDKWARYAVHGK